MDQREDEAEYEWVPPTEAELKVIQARRDRQDKISKLMGEYMLKGYKMLASECDKCDTILLQDKQGVKYCVACSELDVDAGKDDPAVSQQAARRQAQEQSARTGASPAHTGTHATPLTLASLDRAPSPQFRLPVVEAVRPKVQSPTQQSHSFMSRSCTSSTGSLQQSEEVLCTQLAWATRELQQCTNVERCTQLCELLKAAAEALTAIKKAREANVEP